MVEEASTRLRTLLADHGLRCAKVEMLSAEGRGRKAGRRALRVETPDGAVLKVRVFPAADEAARLATLRGRIDAPFLPTMTARGPLLVEPWVEGQVLSPRRAEARAAELGALLGSLHAAGPGGAVPRIDSAPRRAQALADLDRLVAGRALTRSLAVRLRERLLADDPGSAPTVIVHRDFCPENLVAGADGALHLIDNEWLGVDAAGVDLGRTRSRWPMAEATWRELLEGYARTAPQPPDALDFWLIAMAARGSVVRLGQPREQLAVPLDRLRALSRPGADD